MAKILVASIGKAAGAGGEYRMTNYIPGESMRDTTVSPFSTPYIMEAMRHFYQIDKLILFGTAGSRWDTLYQYIFYGSQKLCVPATEHCDADEAQLQALAKELQNTQT